MAVSVAGGGGWLQAASIENINAINTDRGAFLISAILTA
jgi:hypothetical protein